MIRVTSSLGNWANIVNTDFILSGSDFKRQKITEFPGLCSGLPVNGVQTEYNAPRIASFGNLYPDTLRAFSVTLRLRHDLVVYPEFLSSFCEHCHLCLALLHILSIGGLKAVC